MSLRLWGNRASRAFMVHWALHELGLPYEKRLVGSRTGETRTDEFLRMHPAGKIPVLEDGEFVLTETAAIITYLVDTYGDESTLAPVTDYPERAKYYQWCFFAMTELDAQSLYIVHKHTTLAYVYGESAGAVETAKKTFLRQAERVERALEDGRSWILGPAFTAADILLAHCVLWGADYELPLGDKLRAYVDRAVQRGAYRAAVDASTS
jgi:glutathione S-transferase